MFAKYTINVNSLDPLTGTSINIPINMEYQIVDNSELIEKLFVETETQKAVNPILDYEKVRFSPVDVNNVGIGNINYNLNFLPTQSSNFANGFVATYGDIEFDDGDIKFLRDSFTESYLLLSFYDTDNPMTQNLVTEIQIYNRLNKTDYYPSGTTKAGQPKPALQIPTTLTLSNPLIVPSALYEGYHIYTYKDEYKIGEPPKYLYMKATYFNGKTGKFINFMTESTAYKIDVFVNKLYTRYSLYRNTVGFYYKIDTAYSSNVFFSQNLTNAVNKDVTINLFQVQAL